MKAREIINLIETQNFKKTRTNLRKAYLQVKEKTRRTYVKIKDVKKEFEILKGKTLSDEQFAKIVRNNEDVYKIAMEIARKKKEGIKIRGKNIGIIAVIPNDPPTIEKELQYI